jgi:hypothetical protein
MRELDAQREVWRRGEILQAGLRRIAAAHPGASLAVAGFPPCQSLSFALGVDAPAAKTLMVRGMLARGYLASGVIYVMLAHDEERIAGFLSALEEVIADIARLALAGRLQEQAGGVVAKAGFARLT